MGDGYVKVIAASITWGTIGVFARWSGGDPVTLSFFRSLVAAAVFLFIFCCRDTPFPIIKGKSLLLACVSGVCKAAGMLLYFTAINLTTLCYTLFIFYLAPIIVVILTPLFLGEKLQKKSLTAVVLAFCGALLMIFSSVEPAVPELNFKGIAFAFSGALCFSFTIMIAKMLKEVSGLTLAFYQMLVASIILIFVVDISLSLQGRVIIPVVMLGVFHTAFAYTIYYEGIKEIMVQHAGVLLYLDPVVASLLGFVVFREAVGTMGLLGGFLIAFAGIIVITGTGNSAHNS